MLPGCVTLRILIEQGMSRADIARKYNVSRAAVTKECVRCRIES